MATANPSVATVKPADTPLAAAIDRWIFVFTAALIFVIVLTGFVPDSLMKIGLVEAGKRPEFPPILHVHAVLMGSWVSLLLAQTTLMASGNAAYHKRLGLASMVLAPAMILTGFILIPTMYGQLVDAAASATPETVGKAQAALVNRANITLVQIRAGTLFALFVLLALRARKSDSPFHKRMMVLATVVPITAAFARIPWLPTTAPGIPISSDIYVLLVMLPLVGWDTYRLGRLHRAYIVAAAAFFPATVALYLLWGTPWWQATAPKLLGYA